jgi:outer membrane protein assembly factor BamE (lipoprotein component of BamABCDE complex)
LPRPARLPTIVLLAALSACALSACGLQPAFLSYPPQVRGNKVDPDALAQLVPGTSTRADVRSLIGSPTAPATFNDNQWIYISEVTTPVIGGTNDVHSQQVYVMNFGQNGVLESIEHKSLRDSMPVEVVSRTTPSPGSSASFMQQLLGNVGKIAPAGSPIAGGDTGAQGSATNPGNF